MPIFFISDGISQVCYKPHSLYNNKGAVEGQVFSILYIRSGSCFSISTNSVLKPCNPVPMSDILIAPRPRFAENLPRRNGIVLKRNDREPSKSPTSPVKIPKICTPKPYIRCCSSC